jgi:protein required for attachment to host cells
MDMQTRWILVADASRARLFREQQFAKHYDLIGTFEHQESRAHVRDLMADATARKPGGMSTAMHVHGSITGVVHGRPGGAPATDAKQVESGKFAHQLCGILEQALDQHAYDSLVVAAPPRFLGMLRGTMSHEVAKHLEASIDKDLTNLDSREAESRMRDELRG